MPKEATNIFLQQGQKSRCHFFKKKVALICTLWTKTFLSFKNCWRHDMRLVWKGWKAPGPLKAFFGTSNNTDPVSVYPGLQIFLKSHIISHRIPHVKKAPAKQEMKQRHSYLMVKIFMSEKPLVLRRNYWYGTIFFIWIKGLAEWRPGLKSKVSYTNTYTFNLSLSLSHELIKSHS